MAAARWARRAGLSPHAQPAPLQGEAVIRARVDAVLAMAEQVSCFIAPSSFLRDRYHRFGFPRHKMRLLEYGFDVSRWQEERRAAPSPPLRLAYLGTWIPSKGVHVLLEAVREIDPALVELDVHGYAVPYEGVPDYEAQLRRLADGAPHIRMRGRYAPEDVPKLLSDAHVLVVPSIWYENSPLTVREAWLAGIPVIASDHGGLRESVRPELDGWLFPPRDARALRQLIEALARNPARVARARPSRARITPIANHAEILESWYREWLEPGRGHASAAGR
jgi:glycosyltransferase involved in cell wall biosynthesis